jgi:uncharacterized membrane protein YcaP (DUF421 family)
MLRRLASFVLRIRRHELAEQARQHEISSLADVEWAVLETNGKVTFIPKRS